MLTAACQRGHAAEVTIQHCCCGDVGAREAAVDELTVLSDTLKKELVPDLMEWAPWEDHWTGYAEAWIRVNPAPLERSRLIGVRILHFFQLVEGVLRSSRSAVRGMDVAVEL